MEEPNETEQLLIEIRDLQREHLEEYRKIAQHSLELQQQAVARQEQIAKLYRRVVIAGALLVGAAILFLVYISWPR